MITLIIGLSLWSVLMIAALFLALHNLAKLRHARDFERLRADNAASLRNDAMAEVARLTKTLATERAEWLAGSRKCEAEYDKLAKELEQARAPVQKVALEGMDADEFRAAFDVDGDNALWQAVHQLLDQGIVAGVDDVAPAPSAIFTSEGRTHAAGELNALREFQKTLLRWQREARRARTTTTAAAEPE